MEEMMMEKKRGGVEMMMERKMGGSEMGVFAISSLPAEWRLITTFLSSGE